VRNAYETGVSQRGVAAKALNIRRGAGFQPNAACFLDCEGESRFFQRIFDSGWTFGESSAIV
jgi:hypothetical protein